MTANLTSLDALYIAVAFLVPGFIASSVAEKYLPLRRLGAHRDSLKMLTFSVWNYALCSWAIYLVISYNLSAKHPAWVSLFWFYVILLSPIVVGLVYAKCLAKGLPRVLFRLFGESTIQEIPTAWDYVFYKREIPVWVRITLQNGSQICGYYGNESFTSTEPNERDIYLEKILDDFSNGTLQNDARKGGMLIKGQQIESIEFIPITNHENNEEEPFEETTADN